MLCTVGAHGEGSYVEIHDSTEVITSYCPTFDIFLLGARRSCNIHELLLSNLRSTPLSLTENVPFEIKTAFEERR